MSTVLRISAAVSLALHAMVVMSAYPDRPISTREMAALLHGSAAHLSKVLQRLVRAGLLRSIRGPRGGFTLGKDDHEITLLDVYESIESPLESRSCLLGMSICDGTHCVFGGLLETVNRQVREYMAATRLSELRDVCRRKEADAEKNYQDRP